MKKYYFGDTVSYNSMKFKVVGFYRDDNKHILYALKPASNNKFAEMIGIVHVRADHI